MTVSGLGGAVSTAAEDNAADIKQLVIFELAGGIYGLDIQSVREINRLIDVTPIPKAPDFVEGIINLRGTIIPVVDLAMRFGLETTARSKDTRIVVIESEGHTLGMKVDEVSEVLRIKTDEIDEAINMTTTGIDADFVEGVGKVDDRLILILNPDKLFSAEEHLELAEIAVD
ncbi:MAG: purine-binding chemotaxis protein CheW [Candidatus Marinimicrobia bacterium]|nr:purine-binding chemotaxis protein CheW [Candidatus Neomarinimicrobiota bacterium]MCH8023360.1 purine-binding chemotaxis protein CheW [Candidatus Neomarinimicrobiota bacterium]MCH8836325.1 purine-binding chemotaxis protein CheW [Candidatus Neomarinimicrobiota bacterium]